MSLFVRVVTHYGSNESNDSFGFFCEGIAPGIAMGLFFPYIPKSINIQEIQDHTMNSFSQNSDF